MSVGFLSKTAEKSFRKARGRAYVPEWFKPLSYVAAGIVGVFLLILLVLTPDAEPAQTATDPGPGSVITPGTVLSPTSPAPLPGAASSSPAAPGSKLVTVTLQGGGTAEVSLDALLAGQRAARAMFTGEFSGVQMREGTVRPVILDKWPSASAGNVSYAVVFPDGSMSLAFPVDPDGATGPEPVRSVNVLIAPSAGGWVLDPS